MLFEKFSTQRSSDNVPLTVFLDGHDTVGFLIHSFSTFERIKKYDENENAGNVGKPYSIEVRDTERTITIYGIASTRFEVVRFDSLDFFALNRYNVLKHTSDKKFMRILVQR